MKPMLKYIFSLFFISNLIFAQQQDNNTNKNNDSIKKQPQRYGVRIGIDLYKLSKSLYDSDYTGLEVTGDYRISKKFYAAAELGQEKKTVDDDRLNFTTNGTYLKIGFDYNAYENWLDMENLIYGGVRIATTRFSQRLNSYKIYDTTNYYGENTITTNQEFKNLNANWLEFVGGIKAELFKSVFLGFSVRLNYLISEKEPTNFANLYIPGFNKTYDGKFGVGFNYSLSYFIPLYKKNN